MHVPAEITAELSSLERNHDARLNLESIQALAKWLREQEDYCRTQLERGLPTGGKEPVVYAHRDRLNTRGITDPRFGGKSNATLRNWLAWWSTPGRSRHGSEEAGRDPATEAERVRRELRARGADF